MSRKKQTINVILHIPEDQESLDALQEIADNFYAECIIKELSKHNLTKEEKKYIVKKVSENLG